MTPDTLLLSEDGMIEIGEYAPSTVPTGSYRDFERVVLGRDSMVATDQVCRNGPLTTLRVTTGAGFSVEGPHDLPMLVMSSMGRLEWRDLSEIEIGDQMAIQRGTKVFGSHVDLSYAVKVGLARIAASKRSSCMTTVNLPKTMTPELAEFLAMIIAEGYLSGRAAEIVFTQKCPDITARYVSLVRTLFGIELTPLLRPGSIFMVQFANQTLRAYLEALGVVWTRSAGVRMPRAVRVAPESCVKAFLRTLMGLEGCIRKPGPGKIVYELTMASKELIRQIQVALANFGVVATVYKKPGYATNGSRIVRDYWRLIIRGVRNLQAFAGIGLIEARKQAVLDDIGSDDTTARDYIPHAALHVAAIMQSAYDAHVPLCSGETLSLSKMMDRVRRGGRQLTYALAQKIHVFVVRSGITGDSVDWLAETLALNYAFDPVETAEAGFAETVNLCVPGTHGFFANGLLSHNTMGRAATSPASR